MNEIVICIGAGRSQLDYILNIRMMGYKVFCVDRNSDSPGFEIANDYIVTSTYDFEKTPRLILDKLGQNFKIIGAIAPCTGPPYRTLQITKKLYGLPFVREKFISILLDKVLLRNKFNELGLSKIKIYNNNDEIEKSHFPLVKKPRFDGMGGVGVELFLDYNQYRKMYSCNTIDQKYVYEELIYGTELAIDAIWSDNEIYIINIGYNIFEENKIIGSTSEPIESMKRYIPKLSQMLLKLCKYFNFTREVLNIDVIIDTNQNLHIIEIEFVPADGLIHSKPKGYNFVYNYLKCHFEKRIDGPNTTDSLSMIFSDRIGKKHTILKDEINYIKIKSNNRSVNNTGFHCFYSKSNEKLSTFINTNYPMISFKRNYIEK